MSKSIFQMSAGEKKALYDSLSLFKKAEWDYNQARKDGLTGSALAEMMRRWFLSASTTDEVLEVWEATDDEQLGELTLKYEEVFEKGLELATNWYEAKRIFDDDGDEASIRAFEKILSFPETREAVSEIWSEWLSEWMDPTYPNHEKLFQILFKRIHELPE